MIRFQNVLLSSCVTFAMIGGTACSQNANSQNETPIDLHDGDTAAENPAEAMNPPAIGGDLLTPLPHEEITELIPLELGELAVNGTGCAEGSSRLVFDESGYGLALSFDQFVVHKSNETVERAACAVALPMRIPRGFQVAMAAPNLRGYLRLSEGVTATVGVEAFFAGQVNERRDYQFQSESNGPFEIFGVDDSMSETLQWSRCGDDLTLRMNISLRVVGPRNLRAHAEINSLGSDGALLSPLHWRRCE